MQRGTVGRLERSGDVDQLKVGLVQTTGGMWFAVWHLSGWGFIFEEGDRVTGEYDGLEDH